LIISGLNFNIFFEEYVTFKKGSKMEEKIIKLTTLKKYAILWLLKPFKVVLISRTKLF